MRFFVIAAVLSSSVAANAQNEIIVGHGHNTCLGKCVVAVPGVAIDDTIAGEIHVTNTNIDVSTEVILAPGSTVSHSTFIDLDGKPALRITGRATAINATRHQRGVAESTTSFTWAEDHFKIDVVQRAVQVESTNNLGDTGTHELRATFDRKMFRLDGKGTDVNFVPILTVQAGGTVKIAGANGDVLLSGAGGTFVDPFGSTVVTAPQSGSNNFLLEISGVQNGQDAPTQITINSFMDYENDGLIEVSGDNGNIDFRLKLFDASIDSAVIDGQHYSRRPHDHIGN